MMNNTQTLQLPNLEMACFVSRKNRFIAEVALADGTVVEAHLANTGRMRELLVPGADCYVRPALNPARKTAWDLLLIKSRSRYVCLQAVYANTIMHEWLRFGHIAGLQDADAVRREVRHDNSRFDLAFDADGRSWLAEVKSVNLVPPDGGALFPDAPTVRGAKHVRELMQLAHQGHATALFFVVMGQEAHQVRLNVASDPDFAAAVHEAAAAGVHVRAFSAHFKIPEVAFDGEVPLILEDSQWKYTL